jgi:hypothetical protein
MSRVSKSLWRILLYGANVLALVMLVGTPFLADFERKFFDESATAIVPLSLNALLGLSVAFTIIVPLVWLPALPGSIVWNPAWLRRKRSALIQPSAFEWCALAGLALAFAASVSFGSRRSRCRRKAPSRQRPHGGRSFRP